MTLSIAELKKKLRGLKKFELKLRFGSADVMGRAPILVFDAYFDLRPGGEKRARYTVGELAHMERAEFLSVIEEYVAEVYFRAYGFREGGDFTALNALGLPFGADENAIKKRFRELAKRAHPDVGGDAEEFVKLRARYDELIKRK